MTKIKLKLLNIAAVFAILLYLPAAHAISLQQAKAQGLVGERQNGYVGIVVSDPSPDLTHMVSNINGQRNAEYRRIASSGNVSLSTVESIAGQKAIQNTPSGQYVEINGQWVRK